MKMSSQLEEANRQLAEVTCRVASLHNRIADRTEAALRADELSDVDAEREKARRRAGYCRDYQERYDSAYRAHGFAGSPPPMADELPGDFRRRLARGLVDRLPRSSRLSGLRMDDLDTGSMNVFEPEILGAAQREGMNPSYEGRPDSVYDAGAARVRVDPTTGQRTTEFFARRSFIADMSRGGQRVRIADPRTLAGAQRMAAALWR
jgi:hypothetical protein